MVAAALADDDPRGHSMPIGPEHSMKMGSVAVPPPAD